MSWETVEKGIRTGRGDIAKLTSLQRTNPISMDGPVTNCLCGMNIQRSRYLLDLGDQPLAEDMRSDAPKYPLRLVQCTECDLIQLDYIVDQREIFKPDHTYSSGNSPQLHEHFQALADELSKDLNAGDLIVDIGSNDGTLLSKFPETLFRIGVEPTMQGTRASLKEPMASRWYPDFFSSTLGAKIAHEHGRARIVLATNVLAHVPDPHDFLEGVKLLLADDGIFVAENHDVREVLDGQWDTVYHEHLRYYSRETLAKLLEMHDLEITSDQTIDTHGGSFRTYARKRASLQGQADKAKKDLLDLLYDITARQGKTVCGIGATTRASGLIHFMGLEPFISTVCEVSGSDKIGKVMPGTSIRIETEALLFSRSQPEYALLFSWHLAKHIVPKLRGAGFKGKFIVPLPQARILDA